MARTDVQYTGEQTVFEVAVNGCEFVGVVNQKSLGGCDLHLRLWDSELDGLEVPQITELRRRVDQCKEIHVADIPGSLLNPLTTRRAKRELRAWLCQSPGFRYTTGDRLKELLWLVPDFLRTGPLG